MTIAVETYLVVALAFAVFSAVVALGSSLVLGIGFERLRAGFDVVKKQTGFFSESIRTLDKRVDGVEKQGQYFFETLHGIEEKMSAEAPAMQEQAPMPIQTEKPSDAAAGPSPMSLWDRGDAAEVRFH